jgi:hypothetical protein
MMVEFLKVQYKLGKVTDDDINLLVERGEITSEDKNYIMGKEE